MHFDFSSKFSDPKNDRQAQESFRQIRLCLSYNPDLAQTGRRKWHSKDEQMMAMLNAFLHGRGVKYPTYPKTVPDPAYIDVMCTWHQDKIAAVFPAEFSSGNMQDIQRHIAELHLMAMSSENFVGDVLERYLAYKLEPLGWAWAAGQIVRHTDFVYFDKLRNKWLLLQIKNRDSSENSSSSAIREGTEIQKWFRTFSHSGKTNWENFPFRHPDLSLSEEEFREFLRQYVRFLLRN